MPSDGGVNVNTASPAPGGTQLGSKSFGAPTVLPLVAPSLSPEAVLQEDPEAIVSGDRRDLATSGIEFWKQYPSMLAVRRGNLFALDSDLVNRSGPRILAGAAQLCEQLEQARTKRGQRQ